MRGSQHRSAFEALRELGAAIQIRHCNTQTGSGDADTHVHVVEHNPLQLEGLRPGPLAFEQHTLQFERHRAQVPFRIGNLKAIVHRCARK